MNVTLGGIDLPNPVPNAGWKLITEIGPPEVDPGVTVEVLTTATPRSGKAALALVAWLKSQGIAGTEKIVSPGVGYVFVNAFKGNNANPEEGINIIIGKRP